MHPRLFSRRKFLKLGSAAAVVAVVAGIGGYSALQQPASAPPGGGGITMEDLVGTWRADGGELLRFSADGTFAVDPSGFLERLETSPYGGTFRVEAGTLTFIHSSSRCPGALWVSEVELIEQDRLKVVVIEDTCENRPPHAHTFTRISPTPAPTPTQGQILRVPEDFSTIDEAIAVASPGDTIQVGPGTYPSFIIDKSVKVKGSGAGVSIISGPPFVKMPPPLEHLEHTHNVLIEEVNGASLTGFTLEGGDVGVEVGGDGNEISGNTIKAGSIGVIIRGSGSGSGSAKKNKVSDNTIIAADPARLHPEPLSLGMIGGVVIWARGNEVLGNTIEAPGGPGVSLVPRFGPTNNNEVQGNTIKLSAMGIKVRSEGNTILENNLIDNQVQAQDNGSDNVWFKDGKGNYWSDWTSPDDNKDGIVDKPYAIAGKSGSVDRFPLVSPYQP